MLSVEQIQQLETKVGEFVERYQRLRVDNQSLRERLEGYQQRIDEMERRLKTVSDDQAAITEGLTAALRSLEALEDVGDSPASPASSDSPSSSAADQSETSSASEPVFVEIGEDELDPGEEESDGNGAEVAKAAEDTDADSEAGNEDNGEPELEIF